MTNKVTGQVDLCYIKLLGDRVAAQVAGSLNHRIGGQTTKQVGPGVRCGTSHWEFRRMFRQAFIQQHEAT
ncbi:hypothetical protein LCGC14_1571400 [marine sediment metagenome]|uniref:Uncharacterized protein n=1 Tax=marine sediment metagenome TaxID=412755 RepID=A0A0F9IJI3_9ZZZZ